MLRNPGRAVVGYARTFGTGHHDDIAESFGAFRSLELGVPLRWSHQPIMTQRGDFIADLGTWCRFVVVNADGDRPAGLLVLGEVDPGPYGDTLLDVLGEVTSSRWPTTNPWGLSIGANLGHLDGWDVEQVWPYEISVTPHPKDRDALVLGVGARGISLYELLTGEAVRSGS